MAVSVVACAGVMVVFAVVVGAADARRLETDAEPTVGIERAMARIE
jgi:hypothetical protein